MRHAFCTDNYDGYGPYVSGLSLGSERIEGCSPFSSIGFMLTLYYYKKMPTDLAVTDDYKVIVPYELM